MPRTRGARWTILATAASAAIALGALVLAPSDAAADPGWKFYIEQLGGCAIDCTPVPEIDFHCDCYELPPIIIEG